MAEAASAGCAVLGNSKSSSPIVMNTQEELRIVLEEYENENSSSTGSLFEGGMWVFVAIGESDIFGYLKNDHLNSFGKKLPYERE